MIFATKVGESIAANNTCHTCISCIITHNFTDLYSGYFGRFLPPKPLCAHPLTTGKQKNVSKSGPMNRRETISDGKSTDTSYELIHRFLYTILIYFSKPVRFLLAEPKAKSEESISATLWRIDGSALFNPVGHTGCQYSAT